MPGRAGVIALALSCAAALWVLESGCASSSAQQDTRPRVVATTTMIADLVRQIGGEEIRLKVLMSPGVDPHTYKPSTSDLGELSRARAIFCNGLHLEGKMVELLQEKLGERTVAVAEGIDPSRLLAWEQGQTGAYDPHVWFDVKLWTEAAKAVGAKLASMDPPRAATYQQRLKELVERLKSLDQYVKSRAGELPPQRRVLITSHDAYGYFGRAYGFEVWGLQGISTETEAGLANIQSAVDYIVARKVPAIFIESSVSPKTVERVQADCQARGVDVRIGGTLYSDAMGAPGEHPPYAVETYDGMVRYNIDTLVSALK